MDPYKLSVRFMNLRLQVAKHTDKYLIHQTLKPKLNWVGVVRQIVASGFGW